VTLPPTVAIVVLPVVLMIWSGAGWAGHPSQMSRLAAMAPEAAVRSRLSLNASALYIGIAAGAALGQQVLRHGASWQLGFVGAACELGALGLLLIATQRRKAAARKAARVSEVAVAPTAR
jgi:predicted MFS family arabinose efflux permease